MADTATPGRIWFAHWLRGPACVLVMLEHLMFGYRVNPVVAADVGHFSPERAPSWPPFAALFDFTRGPRIALGVIALVQLFLISGFVIPFSLERNSVRSFTVRRLFRVYPTLWAGLAITLTVLAIQARIFHTPYPFDAHDISINATVFAPYVGVLWIEPSCWTLAIEELFYFIAATMAWRRVLGDAKWIIAVSVACAAVAAIPAPTTNPMLFWFEYHVSLLPFVFIGVVAHEVFTRRWSQRKGATIAVALFGIWLFALCVGPMGAVAAPYSRAAALGVLLFAAIAVVGNRLPYNRVVDRLASISYPVYLLHQVVGYVALHALERQGLNFYLALVIVLTFVVASAVLVHHLVEVPSMRVGRRLGARLDVATSRVTAPL